MSEKLAFVFPGQGSQSVGMLADLADKFDSITAHYQQASEVLGFDLWDIVVNGPAEKLNQTEITQPAILVGSIALWDIWQQQNHRQPDFLAGHSLGEYSALVAAGVIQFADAVKLTFLRGKYMAAAVSPGDGAMAAILGLDDAAAQQACEKAAADGVVTCANYNAPGQVVLSGEVAAVTQAVELCKEAGAKRAMLLKVGAPSHCELMRPAAEQLAKVFSEVEFAVPDLPVIHNVDVGSHASVDEIKQVLLQQLYSPVRWVETIQWLAKNGVSEFVECGPGKVLTGLGKRIIKEADHQVMSSML